MSQPVPALIRQATLADVDNIARFQLQMAMETENKSLEMDVVRTAVQAVIRDASKGFYLVAVAEKQVVASLLMTTEWSDWRNGDIWYIQSVFVENEFRGHGIFRKMYDQVVELAKQHDVLFLRLYVEVENKRAQQVYEALGMKRMPHYLYDMPVG